MEVEGPCGGPFQRIDVIVIVSGSIDLSSAVDRGPNALEVKVFG